MERAPLSLAVGFATALTIGLAAHATGQVKKVAAKPPVKNPTRGTTQVAGAYVRFGETYTLKNGANFQILKAAYTMDEFPSYEAQNNSPTEKIVVFDVSVKNWMKDKDLDFGGAGGDFMVLYDAAGNKYTGDAELKSNGRKSLYLTLKPGQGVGQVALKDPYRVGFKVPLDAVITKVMIHQPRLGKAEEVMRYVLDPADKAFDPLNAITPLPPEVRDPADKTGAVALKEGKGKVGLSMAAGPFAYEVQKIEPNVGALSEKVTPEEGHHFLVVTLKMTNVDPKAQELFDAKPRDAYVTDADGDKHTMTTMLKASSAEEAPSGEMGPGESRTIRLVFDLSVETKLQSLTLAGSYYPWRLDLGGAPVPSAG